MLLSFIPCCHIHLTLPLPSPPPPPPPPKCNWKVNCDNYLDAAYHVPYAHKALSGNLDLASYTATDHEGYSIQSCVGVAGEEEGGSTTTTRVGKAALYAHVYPSLMLNRYGPWMDTNMVFPIGPRECEIVFDYFLEEGFIEKELGGWVGGKLAAYVEESLAASDEVQQEDTYLCENVQIGLESQGYDMGRYAPQVEYLDHTFHCRLAEELKRAVERVEKEALGGAGV